MLLFARYVAIAGGVFKSPGLKIAESILWNFTVEFREFFPNHFDDQLAP